MSLLIQIIVAAVVLAPALWIVGKWFVGKDKAKFTDSLWIAVLGVLIAVGVGAILPWWGALFGTLIMISGLAIIDQTFLRLWLVQG